MANLYFRVQFLACSDTDSNLITHPYCPHCFGATTCQLKEIMTRGGAGAQKNLYLPLSLMLVI